MSNYEFQYNLDIDSAIIIANIKQESEKKEEIKEEEYIYLESPITRINEVNYQLHFLFCK